VTAFLGLWRVWLALALIGGAFYSGIKVESDHRDAQMLAAEKAWEDSYIKGVAKQRAVDAAVSGELAAARARARATERTLRERINNASSLSACGPAAPAGGARPSELGGAADPLGVCTFTGSFVRLWDDASFQGLAAADGAGGADAAPGEARAVDAREVLTNHAENSAICNDLRAQITAWQRWAVGNGLAQDSKGATP
jgi:hypothetical protein